MPRSQVSIQRCGASGFGSPNRTALTSVRARLSPVRELRAVEGLPHSDNACSMSSVSKDTVVWGDGSQTSPEWRLVLVLGCRVAGRACELAQKQLVLLGCRT
jgi:hypothetical protein